jgi:hypothetical protein
MNRLPIPDRHGYDHGRYQRFWIEWESLFPGRNRDHVRLSVPEGFLLKTYLRRSVSSSQYGSDFEEIRDIREWGYDGLGSLTAALPWTLITFEPSVRD